ncbi:MAG: methyl-accepting chemotaxis protein [Oscillospiraceae bacterium]|jgi:methyl-accepting chemotaxis protein|nr:methyl-accepting chemotaxis protein [Oscillospiraceae bacterium]
MKNLKISQKLFIGFGAAIALMAVIAIAVVITNLMSINAVKNIETANEFNDSLSSTRSYFYEMRIPANKMFLVYTDDSFKALTDAYNLEETDMATAEKNVNDNKALLGQYLTNVTDANKATTDYYNATVKVKDAYAAAATAKDQITTAGGEFVDKLSELNNYLFDSISKDTVQADTLRHAKQLKDINDVVNTAIDVRLNIRSSVTYWVAADEATADKSITDMIAKIESIKSEFQSSNTKKMMDDVITYAAAYQTAYESYSTANRTIDSLVVDAGNFSTTALTEFDKLNTITTDLVVKQIETASNIAVIALIIVIAIVIFAVIVALTMAITINKSITGPVQFLSNILSEVGVKGRVTFSEQEWQQMRTISEGKDEVAQSVGVLGTMARRLGEIGQKLGTVAAGDLTAEVSVLSPDDLMGNSLHKMLSNLNGLFRDINSATAEVQSGATQISEGAQSLAQGSTEQAATVQQLSASIADVSSKTKENTEMANNAAALANVIKANAEKGNSQMGEMTSAVQEINKASQDISKVIKVIDDIAFQTNILALNAAVEAARAGEAGKGFAVVADEVRNLASKSAAAAKETGALIENSMKKAELGAQIASETAVSLGEIVSGINESAVIVSGIAISSDEQNTAITQINEAIEQVSEVVQRNSATAEESAASSEELNAQSNILAANVAKFKLRQDISL